MSYHAAEAVIEGEQTPVYLHVPPIQATAARLRMPRGGAVSWAVAEVAQAVEHAATNQLRPIGPRVPELDISCLFE